MGEEGIRVPGGTCVRLVVYDPGSVLGSGPDEIRPGWHHGAKRARGEGVQDAFACPQLDD